MYNYFNYSSAVNKLISLRGLTPPHNEISTRHNSKSSSKALIAWSNLKHLAVLSSKERRPFSPVSIAISDLKRKEKIKKEP